MFKLVSFLSLFIFFSPKSNTSVNSDVLLQLVNNIRKKGCKCGGTYMKPVQPVTWNNQLAQAAYNHSKFMNDKQRFSHTGRRGSDPGNRIRAAGYKWKAYGENIGYNYPDERSVIIGWLGSVNHCKNIMNPNFKEMGVAKVGAYWTQDFGAK
jgi:uncharacterized protein YkwD